MSLDYIPALEIFLAILGLGLFILLCTTFCRMCGHLRREERDRDTWRYGEQDGRPPPIYFIPFTGGRPRQDGEEHVGIPRYSQEVFSPPQYSNAAFNGPPPSYNELGFKPDDLPPAYTEYNVPTHPIIPPAHTSAPPPES